MATHNERVARLAAEANRFLVRDRTRDIRCRPTTPRRGSPTCATTPTET
jgi:hypothetical protein